MPIAMTIFPAIALMTRSEDLHLVAEMRVIWGRRATSQKPMPRQICNANRSMCHVNVLVRKASNIQEGADMESGPKAGDAVRLLGLPSWLLHDLPEDEQAELLACVGKVMQVQEIDSYGYSW
ncbi:MAG: hypothetical protein IPG42_20420 [Betaproteobacteria bacterium]|nr:hypothetical protein [Betaproteobacteria bacterium]